ncbi:ATP-binding protein [Falsiroseomonas stagni]|uniref:ATP-binding protein n=1 Tax=Falsiroseomonas stagni TaxID=484882 RepID=UPI000B885C92|nr:ATP-binding protein [Falsiroseomonas stagni]
MLGAAVLSHLPAERAQWPLLTLVIILAGVALVAAVLWRGEVARAETEAASRAAVAKAETEQHAAKLHADMLATAAHEIRTPLGGVLGLLDLVLGGTGLSRAARADAMAARQAASDLMLLLRDLIEVPGEVKAPLASDPFRIDETMDQVVALLRARAAAHGNRLAVAIATGTHPAWRGDAARIRQILTNLAANAIRFTEGGEVRIEARETAAGLLQLSVSDTGAGIATDRMATLFDRFQRSEQGTGLGLSICRDLAARMGGGIAVTSAPGRGSLFTVTLPLLRVADEEVVPPEHAAPVPTLPSPARRPGPPVLVVDDVPVNRRLLGHVLDRAGWGHEEAGDAATALTLVQSRPYAAVLMDLQMPEVDGLEATRRLRALSGPAGRLPVIAVTAQGGEDVRAQAEAAGMDAFLVKPVSAADLTAVITRALANRAKQAGGTPL